MREGSNTPMCAELEFGLDWMLDAGEYEEVAATCEEMLDILITRYTTAMGHLMGEDNVA